MKKIVKSVIVSVVASLITSGMCFGLRTILSKDVLLILTSILILTLVFLVIVLYLFIINKNSKNPYKFLKQGMQFGLRNGGGSVTFDYISIFRPDYIHYITSDGKKGVAHYTLIYIYL